MKHRFKYVRLGLWYRPIIRVALRLNKVEFDYLALLDSGADFNVFHGGIARILKIDLGKLKEPVTFGGIKQGAEGRGYFTSIDVGINGKFINTPVVFSNDISENGYGVLGQQGFFNFYRINFNYRAKEIVLER